MPSSDSEREDQELRFLLQVEQDLDKGELRPTQDYLKAYPGCELVIEERLAREAEGTPTEAHRIGRFRVLDVLGQGGQGVVYRALDPDLERTVAVKVLRGFRSEAALTRLKREAEISSRIDHPSICPVLEIGQDEHETWVVLKEIQGQTLREWARMGEGPADHSTMAIGLEDSKRALNRTIHPRNEPSSLPAGPPLNDRLAVIEKVARALHAAHLAGVVHRDVKPGNILIDRRNHPVVCDFGLALETDSQGIELTMTRAHLGTPSYMSPEQIEGKSHDATPAVDIWALGVTLYELLTGQRPFAAPTREAMYERILVREPAEPRSLNAQISRDLAAIISTALEKDPTRRYSSAKAFADDLSAARLGQPVSVKPLGRMARSVRWVRKRPAQATVVALTIALLAAGAAATGWLAAKLPDLELGEQVREANRLERYLHEGYLQIGEGEYEEAVLAFDAALKLDATNEAATAGLLITHWRNQSLQLAEAVLAQRKGPLTPGLARFKCDLLRAQQRTAEADALSATLAPLESSLDWFVEGTRALDAGERGVRGQFERALRCFEAALARAPSPVSLYAFMRAHAAGHLGESHQQSARDAAAQLTLTWPKSVHAWFWAGWAVKEFDAESALKFWNQAEAMSEDNQAFIKRLRPSLAGLYEDQGDLQKAEELYKESIAEYGLTSSLCCFYSQCLKDMERLAEANAILDRGLKRWPRDSDLIMVKGNLLVKEGRPELALPLLKKAVALNPSNGLNHYNLGIALRDAEMGDPARDAFEAATIKGPSYLPGWSELARITHRLRGPKAGLAVYDEALQRFPNSSTLRFNHAICLVGDYQFGTACRAARDLSKDAPSYASGYLLWIESALKLGDLVEATRAVEAAEHNLSPAAYGRIEGQITGTKKRIEIAEQLLEDFSKYIDEDRPKTRKVKLSTCIGLAEQCGRWGLVARHFEQQFDHEKGPKALRAAYGALRAYCQSLSLPQLSAKTPTEAQKRARIQACVALLNRALQRIEVENLSSGSARNTVAKWALSIVSDDPVLAPLRDLQPLHPELRKALARILGKLAAIAA